jgi:hypothetical protein
MIPNIFTSGCVFARCLAAFFDLPPGRAIETLNGGIVASAAPDGRDIVSIPYVPFVYIRSLVGCY